MPQPVPQKTHQPRPTRKDTLWCELLAAAVAGLYPSDQHLEQMLDWLEQTP